MSKLSDARPLLWERCGGFCEVSGVRLNQDTFDIHHRRNKGMGGTSRDDVDALYNLLALDPHIHNGGPRSVHGRRDWSQARGYLIPKDEDHPELWPVLLFRRAWMYLDSEGGYYPPPRLFAVPTVRS